MNHYLAIDIGASSGRHILGHKENGKIVLEEIYRFDNLQVRKNGHDCWDIDNLWIGILNGLRACKEKNKIPVSLGIDTWGVDFVLLDARDRLIGDAVSYRDARTNGMDKWVEKKISPFRLYERTGIQKASYNTVYQLAALQREHPEQTERADRLMMTPDYWNFRLTGVKTNEYSIASTTNLLNAADKKWDTDVISALGFPAKIFHDLSMPGTAVGKLRKDLAEELGFDTTVLLPATHDTGSAFLAVPAVDDDAVYISSGTWSLLGVENPAPITNEAGFERNFSNEGGAWGRYRYLKNIMGLWMIQSVRRELNGTDYVRGKDGRTRSEKQWTFPDLIAEARKAESFPSVPDVNDEKFLAPDSMISAVREACEKTNQPVPRTVGEIVQCIYSGLSKCYADNISDLESLTGKHYTSINIVGGGCRDDYLNFRTAKAAGLPVYAGPTEGSAIGNILVQMISAGEFPDLQSARDAIRAGFQIKCIR